MDNLQWISTQTASSSPSLNFDNMFSSSYVYYRIFLKNILPDTANANLYLLLGTGSSPVTYLTSGYIFQLSNICNGGANQSSPGYAGTPFNQVLLTYGNGNGVSTSSTYGGINGTIDLSIDSGLTSVGSGVSHLTYETYDDLVNYANTTSGFQHPAANFTSVQLLMSTGNIDSGSAYLYGITAS